METTRIEVNGVKIIKVSSPEAIASIAEEKGLNPQEVFVRVTFARTDAEGNPEKDSEGNIIAYKAANKLKFFKKEGYEKLLAAQRDGTLVDIVLSKSAESNEIFMYLAHEKVAVDSLFSIPVKAADNRRNLEDLF